MAFGAPILDFKRRKSAPSDVLLLYNPIATSSRARLARLAEGRDLPLNCFPPDTLLPGHKQSHEAKCFTVFHAVRSFPISDKMVNAVLESIPGIAVRSTPNFWWSRVCKSNSKPFFCFFGFRARIGISSFFCGYHRKNPRALQSPHHILESFGDKNHAVLTLALRKKDALADNYPPGIWQ